MTDLSGAVPARGSVATFVKPVILLAGLLAIGIGAAHLGLTLPNGRQAPLMFVAVAGLLTAIGLPRQVVCFGAGYAFGVEHGLIWAMAAQLLSCMADFYWARFVARDWVRRFLRSDRKGRMFALLVRADRLLARRPFGTALMLRLLPVGNNVALNLGAGVSAAPAWAFFAASAVGYLPQTLVFLLAGSGVQVGQGAKLALTLVLLAASIALGAWCWRRLPDLETDEM